MASNECNTGKQGGSPALKNNFSAKNSFGKKNAPAIGSPSFKPSPNSENRGKDGTQG
jgi:hypothetical protein